MNKKQSNPVVAPQEESLVVTPKDKGLFVISYNGLGFAARINGQSLTELMDIARKSLVAQMKKEKENGRQEEGKEVRTEGAELTSEATESVDGDTSTGGVSSQVHGPEKSDVR